MTTYEQLLENNGNWVKEMNATNPNYFPELAKGQEPEFLYIGCVDSRAPIEVMVGAKPGEFFTHRNVANVVSTYDANAMSVMHYAIHALGVKQIIVCGHTGCGGVKAALTEDSGVLNPWINNIRDVYRKHQAELDQLSENERWDKLVELNVRQQCENVRNSTTYKEAQEKGIAPKVHGWVYDLSKDGRLRDLKISEAVS